MNRHSEKRFYSVFIIVLLLAASLLLPTIMSAQDGTPIEISGVVSAAGADMLTVAGLPVDVSGITLDASVTVGTTVTVRGHLLSTNVIVAQTVVITIISGTPTAESTAEATAEVTPEVTPGVTPSPSPTPDPNLIIVIEGPVVNIVNNFITIYDFDVEVAPAHPILTVIDIGDIVHVEGAFGSSGAIVATVVSNISSTTIVSGASVGLEGPVEAINGNLITVNGVPVQLAPNDPLLQSVQVGNFVSVQGNFEGSGSTIVLVVINITIVNNVIVNGDPFCWFHEGMGMGMGHWHCDGMGMGMGMGMGDPAGMGDAMGMGG